MPGTGHAPFRCNACDGPGGGSSLRWLVLPVGCFLGCAEGKTITLRYHTQYDSAGNLPAHQTSSLPGPSAARSEIFMYKWESCCNPSVPINVCIKRKKNTHTSWAAKARNARPRPPQRDTYLWRLQRMWVEGVGVYFASRPLDRPTVRCVCPALPAQSDGRLHVRR